MFYLLLLLFLTKTSSLYCNNVYYENIQNIDYMKYLGLWYEYSHSENFIFENNCKCVTAEYTLDNNNIIVNNTCITNNYISNIIGEAIIDSDIDGRLDVKFYKFQKYDPYDIVYLTKSYDVAVVLSCEYMWFLTRYKNPDINLINDAISNISNLIFNKQIITNLCN